MRHTFILPALILLSGFSSSLFSQDNSIEQDSTLAMEYIDKAVAAFQKNDMDVYKNNLEKAIPLFERSKQWETFTSCKSAIAKYYYDKEDFESFNEHILEASKDAKAYLNPENRVRIDVANNLALSYKNKGQLKRAINIYKETINISPKSNLKIRQITALYQNISTALRNEGDYDEAINYLDELIHIQRDSLNNTHPLLGKTFMDLGHLNRDKNNFEDSKVNYYKAIRIFEKSDYNAKPIIGNFLVSTYQGLSKVFLTNGNVDSSLFHINKALEFQSDKYKTGQITTYEALGNIYLYQKDIDNALKNYTTSNEIAIEQFASYNKQSIVARTFNNIGNAHLSNDAFDTALQYYQLALINSSFNFDNTSIKSNPSIDSLLSKIRTIDIIKGKSSALLKKHEQTNNLEYLELAYNNYEFAAKIIKALRKSFLTEGSKNELAEQSLEIYQDAIRTAISLFRKTGEAKYLESALQFTEQNKARLLEESLQDNHAQIAGGLPLEELETEKELNQNIAFYEENINREQSKSSDINHDKIKIWNNTLFKLRNDYNELINRFENEYPVYYTLKYEAKKISVDELRNQFINNKNVLLEYYVGTETIYLFSITQNDFNVFEINKSTEFEKDINTLRSIVSQSPLERQQFFDEDRNNFAKISHALFKSLLEPAINNLSPKINQIILIPDDILASINFDLLLTNKYSTDTKDYSIDSFDYLFKKYAISYNYSASLLLNYSNWKQNNDLVPFMGFAPTFGDKMAGNNRACSENGVYTLQCNTEEVSSIHNLINGETKMYEAANVESFNKNADQCRILHLATHACIDENNPDLNRIYFSDDYVTGTDLNNLKLNAELAVLSACNTGSGKLVKGEGVMSLSRSFILAGCPSTLTSLWSVDDCTTSEIMVRYYENLKAGLSKDAALRKAKLDHLVSADKVNSHPYYWAAFIQSGNINPMIIDEGFSNYWFFLILPALFLFILFIKNNKNAERQPS